MHDAGRPPVGATLGERVAYLPESDALVVADLHVGRDRTAEVALPLGERGDLTERLGAALEAFAPATVVFAGDLLESFGTVPDGVPETVTTLEERVAAAGADLAVTPGNHDRLLEAVCSAPTAPVRRFPDDDAVVCHGHERPAPDTTPDGDADAGGGAETPTEAPLYVIGHDHPAIVIEGERHPCFLYGPAADRPGSVLVLPAFSRLPAGSPVNSRAEGHSPLVGALDAYRPGVPSEGEVLWFPRLATLRPML